MLARVAVATLLGLLVGLVIALTAGAILDLDSPPVGFWGVLYGSLGGVATLGIALAILGPGRPLRRAGRLVAAAGFAVLAAGVTWWALAWGVPSPLSPEGAWMWPAAVGSAAIAMALTWSGTRRGTRRS